MGRMNRGMSLGKIPEKDIGSLVKSRKLTIIIQGFSSHIALPHLAILAGRIFSDHDRKKLALLANTSV